MQQFVKSNGKSSLLISVLSGLAILGFATLCLASGGEGGAHHPDTGAQLKDFAWRVLDFSLLVAILWWAIKKANVKGALADRRSGIEKALSEAVTAKEAAERKIAEYADKLAQANKEIDEIQAAMKRDGESEKERIIAEAKAAAIKIREQATQAAEQEILRARAELREEAGRLAVQLAEQTLKQKIEKNDQDRLVGEYLAKVVNLK
ncbi:ATP synthase subunit b [Geobacter sp. OR-1]|uniref:F0F1 ATP synthase subunit B family protein n=1 Tax=Geobacter sp. OR-1 TaxID=1266765 RepID=UPI0005432175|nr:ATP synthase F0 subunit B [Geobacter sp. OR-1]GAM11280.1 ATP synthase subunit b [Geobacter sp. OR-1]